MNAEDFKKIYKNLPDGKLIQLYKEKSTLNPLAVTVLTEELEQRHLLETLNTSEPEKELYQFKDNELEEFVKARLADGESIESIRLDLLDHGVDIKKDLKVNLVLEQEIMDAHLNQSLEGKSKSEVYEDLKSKYNIDDKEIERIKAAQKPTGILYLLAGIFMILMAVTSGGLFVYYTSMDQPPARYLLTSFTFFVLAYKSIKKYNILRSK